MLPYSLPFSVVLQLAPCSGAEGAWHVNNRGHVAYRRRIHAKAGERQLHGLVMYVASSGGPGNHQKQPTQARAGHLFKELAQTAISTNLHSHGQLLLHTVPFTLIMHGTQKVYIIINRARHRSAWKKAGPGRKRCPGGKPGPELTAWCITQHACSTPFPSPMQIYLVPAQNTAQAMRLAARCTSKHARSAVISYCIPTQDG